MKTHRFVTPKTSRFVQIGELSDTTEEVVFALHGFGQLAAGFAQLLTPLEATNRVIICPEALSRFYTSHKDRKVGATWMTSEDREFEIMDYVTYLDGLAETILQEAPEHVRVVVFGFSQGCHTASRWIGNGGMIPDKLILWGADQAQDLTEEEWESLSDTPSISLIAGSNDKFLTEDRVISAEEAFRDHQCAFRTTRFEGGHEIDPTVLLQEWTID